MSDEIKLLPCPFCGEKAEIIKHRSGGYAVECTECYGKTHRSVTEKLAIERWNTRKPIDRIVEQLQEKSTEAVNAADREISFDYRQMDYVEAEAFTEAADIVKGGGVCE